jgi:hypothetical protein
MREENTQFECAKGTIADILPLPPLSHPHHHQWAHSTIESSITLTPVLSVPVATTRDNYNGSHGLHINETQAGTHILEMVRLDQVIKFHIQGT